MRNSPGSLCSFSGQRKLTQQQRIELSLSAESTSYKLSGAAGILPFVIVQLTGTHCCYLASRELLVQIITLSPEKDQNLKFGFYWIVVIWKHCKVSQNKNTQKTYKSVPLESLLNRKCRKSALGHPSRWGKSWSKYTIWNIQGTNKI